MPEVGAQLDEEALRGIMNWSRDYKAEWDDTPGEYAEHAVVGWGRSKRLGILRLGAAKAYIGVQHVDPSLAGWAVVEAPQARFFMSYFLHGKVLTLRTFPYMKEALASLLDLLNRRPK